jgi:cytochrome c biogenesis protein CcmG, thiol:disulfide interchange protein DsbE
MPRNQVYAAVGVLCLALIGMVFAWGRLHSTSSLHSPTIAQQLKPVKLRGPVPQFSAQTLDNATVTNAQLTGKPTVLAFFSTWCGPCQDEAAGLGRLARSYGNRVRFIGVDISDTAKSAPRRFTQKYGWSFPVIWDPDQHLVDPFHIDGQPSMILIDGTGKLALLEQGEAPIAQYRKAIDKLEAG